MNRSGESYQRTNDMPSHAGKMPHSAPAVLPSRGRPSKVNRGGMRSGMQYQDRRRNNIKQSGSRMLIPVPNVDRMPQCDKDNHGADNTTSPADDHTKPDVQVPPEVTETNAPSVTENDTNETKASASASSSHENNSVFNDSSYQISEQESKELKAIENEQKNKRKDEEELRRLEVERAGQNRHHYYGGARVINNNPHINSNASDRFVNYNRYIPQRDYHRQRNENRPPFINPNPVRRNNGYPRLYEQRRPPQMLSRRPSHHALPPHPHNPPQQKPQTTSEVVVEDTVKPATPKIESVSKVKTIESTPQESVSEVVIEQSERTNTTSTTSTTSTTNTTNTTNTTPKETQSLGFFLEGDDCLVVKKELEAWKTKLSYNESTNGETRSDCGFILQDGPEQPPQPAPSEAYTMFYQAPYPQFCGYPYTMNCYYVPVEYPSWKGGYIPYPG